MQFQLKNIHFTQIAIAGKKSFLEIEIQYH